MATRGAQAKKGKGSIEYYVGRIVFGRLITRARERLGKTQADIAKSVGFQGHNSVSYIERGIIGLPPARLVAYANAIEVSPIDLKRWHLVCEEVDNGIPIDLLDDLRLLSVRLAQTSGHDRALGNPQRASAHRELNLQAGLAVAGREDWRPTPGEPDLELFLIRLLTQLFAALPTDVGEGEGRSRLLVPSAPRGESAPAILPISVAEVPGEVLDEPVAEIPPKVGVYGERIH